MNREQAKNLLPIIEAFANGETIQFRSVNGWIDHYSPSFDSLHHSRFRIKPKPRECFATIYKGDTISSTFKTKDEANFILNGAVLHDRDNWEVVKFIEVTDEPDM